VVVVTVVVVSGLIGVLYKTGYFKGQGTPQSPAAATSQPTTGTVSDLCKELQDQSIDLDSNNYRGVVGPAGIKLVERGHETFRFETEVVFSGEDIKREFGGILRDPIVGTCRDNVITLDRKLRDGSTHRHTGKLSKAETGRTEIKGIFESDGKTLNWSGRIVNPSRK
jgi:hypothetical protein